MNTASGVRVGKFKSTPELEAIEGQLEGCIKKGKTRLYP